MRWPTCSGCYATCPRPRHVVIRVLTARAAAEEVRAAEARGLRTGILFGPERAGLDAEDMAQADTLVRYPLNPAFDSLNLAQAVMVMAYEWWTAAETTPPARSATHGTRVATKGELEQFLMHLVDQLDACGFLRNAPKRPGMVRNIRHLFERGEVTEQELRTCTAWWPGWRWGGGGWGGSRTSCLAPICELRGKAAGQQPADEGGGGAADADQDQAERLAVDGEVHADAEHQAADQAAGDAGRDAEPEDFAACDHAGKLAGAWCLTSAGGTCSTRVTAGNVDGPSGPAPAIAHSGQGLPVQQAMMSSPRVKRGAAGR